MSLDHDYLTNILRTLRDEQGRGFYTELQSLSNVANIGRYARGEKQASFETWLKLHNAMPNDVPAPCYKEDSLPAGMVSTGDNNRLVQTSNYVEGTYNYSDDLIELMKILDQYAPKVEIKKLLRQYRKLKHDAETL